MQKLMKRGLSFPNENKSAFVEACLKKAMAARAWKHRNSRVGVKLNINSYTHALTDTSSTSFKA